MEQPSVHTLAILLLRSFSSHTHTSQADTEDLQHKLKDRMVVMSGMVEGVLEPQRKKLKMDVEKKDMLLSATVISLFFTELAKDYSEY